MSAEPRLPGLGLLRMQRWMQAVIEHPGPTVEAVATPAAVAEIADPAEVILPSATLEPTARVQIYHRMYLLRMEEALASDYKSLKHFLGDDAFFDLVRDYVQQHPSRYYSLNRLGDHLPAFIAGGGGKVKSRGFCHDLARLELALTEAFDAPEAPALTTEQIAAVAPEDWERARLAPIPGFRLLALRHNVSAYMDSLRGEGHDHPAPRRKASWVTVYRHDWSVWRHDLTEPAHDLLADLVSGRPLAECIAAALQRGKRAPSEHELFRWFREWAAGGVFQTVDLGGPAAP